MFFRKPLHAYILGLVLINQVILTTFCKIRKTMKTAEFSYWLSFFHQLKQNEYDAVHKLCSQSSQSAD